MFSINRILVPTDLSDLAGAALAYACDLAKIVRAEVHVLNVVALPQIAAVPLAGPVGDSHVAPVAQPPADKIVAEKTSNLRDYVRRTTGDLPLEPISVVRVGLVAAEIVQYVEDFKIDLIFIGSHARSMVKRIFLGSTSKSVLEHASCPVLMVPIATVEASRE